MGCELSKPVTTSPNSNCDDLQLQGVSVDYLNTTFIKDLKNAGHDINKVTVYDLEPDLESEIYGFIRRKGAKVICPRDGKVGASYVDSIKEKAAVGKATIMLSYCWAYRVIDIVKTLQEKCITEAKDPKQTYVWICCLCNNQHRVDEVIPFEEFQQNFFHIIRGVGTVWSLMTPWNDPVYFKRVWSMFEFFVSNQESAVYVDIIMPKKEKDNMIQSLSKIKTLLDALARSRIENAKASFDEDKKYILSLVEEEYDGCTLLNNQVNDLMRQWIIMALERENSTKYSKDIIENSTDLDLANGCDNIGDAFKELEEYESALNIYEKAFTIRKKVLEHDHASTATSYHNIGVVLERKGDYDGALDMLQKSLTIREKVLKNDDVDTASSYHMIGYVLRNKEDYDNALEMLQKALTIYEKTYGYDHPSALDTYEVTGFVLERKGDYDGALKMLQKALAIKVKTFGKDHPDTASSYQNIGFVLNYKGDYDGALEMYRKGLAINEEVFGNEHTCTAISYNNIGLVLRRKRDFNGALEMYQKALAIQEKAHGNDHSDTATSYNNIGYVLSQKGDHDDALDMYQKALTMREKTFGKDHPSTASSYNNIGTVLRKKGDNDGALDMYQKSFTIREKTFGKRHSLTIQTRKSIDYLRNSI